MARDEGLEELVREEVGEQSGLAEARMFGGVAWLLDGKLLCAASQRGLLVRLGKGGDDWARATPGITAAVMGGRPMSGWVRASPEAFGDDVLRRRLLACALAFVRTLPGK
jgi:hypothetical protein